jgi:hypothetical protein
VGSRPYVPGDPRRHIHWRNTARAGRPMVRELEDPQDQTLYLLFDATQVWGEDRDTTLEYAIKIVAAVAAHARRQAVPVQVWGGSRFPRGSPLMSHQSCPDPTKGATWPELLHSLALAAPGDGPSLAQSLSHLPAGANALVVVCAGDPQGLQALRGAAPELRQLSVVRLEGFGEFSPDRGRKAGVFGAIGPPAGASLGASGSLAGGLLVPCRPGQLQETLQDLEQANDSGAAVPAPGPAQPANFAEVGA